MRVGLLWTIGRYAWIVPEPRPARRRASFYVHTPGFSLCRFSHRASACHVSSNVHDVEASQLREVLRNFSFARCRLLPEIGLLHTVVYSMNRSKY